MQLDEEMERVLEDIRQHSKNHEENACNKSYGMPSSKSRGRLKPEPEIKGENRTAFARDRDRILYSKAFFRLSGKTQVFMSPKNPLISNRMTHTIHVAQLSRAIARSLHLNEDLAEAIALGHDTGHPPFGHRGEKILDEISMKYLGKPFLHNVHSLRMLDVLERRGNGLNLSYEVREGIVKHCGEVSTGHFITGEPEDNLLAHYEEEPSTLEGCIVKVCDRIAYVGKDIEDATTSGIIHPDDIPEKITSVLGSANSQMIGILVKDLILNFYRDREEFIKSNGREPNKKEIGIRLSEPVLNALNSLIHEFNYPRIYLSDTNNAYSAQTENMVRGLFKHFLNELDSLSVQEISQSTLMHFNGDEENPLTRHTLKELESLVGKEDEESMSAARRFIIYDNLKDFQGSRGSILHFLEDMEEEYWLTNRNPQIIIDYITFMTDTMAMAIYQSLTIPRPIV